MVAKASKIDYTEVGRRIVSSLTDAQLAALGRKMCPKLQSCLLDALGAKETPAKAIVAGGIDDRGYSEFWAAYPPRGPGQPNPRGKALEEYRKLLLAGVSHATIMAGLMAWKAADGNRVAGTEYCPMASNFLRHRQFEVTAPTVSPQQPSGSLEDYGT